MFRQVVVLVAVLLTYFVSCAKISGRIVGGSAASNINLPWIVSIVYYGKHVCGGSIINKRTVLTAAHCVKYYEVSLLKIRVGSKTKSSGGELIPVASTYFNEEFEESNMDYDIGVVRLAQDLMFSSTVQPISLPHYREAVPDGSNALVSGWGYYTLLGPGAEYLQYAVIPIINQVTCNRLLKNVVTDRMLCAGVLKGGIDACQMDSGGPLVVNGKLVGIVSWGIFCALPNKPGVYTMVSEQIPWLVDYLKQFNETI